MLITSLFVALAVAQADVTPHAGMLRWPAVSADRIAFVYANDIWTAARGGGMATPLASPPGLESYPRFSPDGKTIAFVGNYDGNRDLYTIPVAGGIPTRVTHHPAGETLSQWMPDGRLLFMSNGLAGLGRQTQLFAVNATGGMPEQLPVPYGGFAQVSPDGTWLAYTPHSTDNRTWKRYMGGMATDIWLFNLKDHSSKKITDWEGTDTIPMWVPGGAGDTVYYLCDAGPEHRLNIWSYRVKDGKREQLTTFKDWDVKWPSIGPGPKGRGEVVFQLGAELHLFDLGSRKDTVVTVTVPGDRTAIRPHAEDASKTIQGSAISPGGKRVLLEARGDVWSLPAKEGVTRNLTRTDAVYERGPSWSPDGRWIAYFSDEGGEYDLYVRPSDAREEEKKGDKAGDKEEGDGAETPPESRAVHAVPRRLTDLGPGFKFQITWSPDSKWMAYTDQGGVLRLTALADGATKEIDTDPWGDPVTPAWAGDSGWIAYSLNDDANNLRCVWLYNLADGTKTRVTSPMFASMSPAFDRKGDYLYLDSARTIDDPTYSDLDTTFIYTGTEALYAIPLRTDIKSPWTVKSDEEALRPDTKKEEKKNGDEKKDEGKKDEPKKDAAPADDGVSGTWDGTATSTGEGFPAGGLPFTMIIHVKDGVVTGRITSQMAGADIMDGTYDAATGQIRFTITVQGQVGTLSGTVKDGRASGTWDAPESSGTWTMTRTAPAKGDDGQDGTRVDDKDKDAPKPVKIDLQGMEHRMIALPIPTGNFGQVAVTADDKVIYVRRPAGDGESGIKIFDPADDSKEEKAVTNAGGFDLSADGKKILVARGSSLTVMDAAAGGGKSSAVPTVGMSVTINPRDQWRQVLTDVYRLERDYFYEPTMHGVDWKGLLGHYMKMIDFCSNREDVGYVIAEYISELNIGHAYLRGLGDVESDVPAVSVGMLGCDYELVKSDAGAAYRISKVYEGGPWDADARGPLSQPDVGVKAGDYLLAVNGVPVDTDLDPWAAFLGTADRPTIITVGAAPSLTDPASPPRDVLVKPLSGESNLRYRAWIEHNRAYVAEKTGGRVGYIYVPNTGADGQSDLFRQFFGQRSMEALIIDERWNGGGQIPTRFIELLNRPATNFWARRYGHDWPWPPDAHFGPKCMLINGLAGSGGDMFPWLFKHDKLGPVIGTRTWGGLVGYSGNPGLIDGGSVTVPMFGFYELDGTWGVEGHGVDPDIAVIDDPALMVSGGDPQLDRAIAEMTRAIETGAFKAPKRPRSPDRKGMGIPVEDQ
ncbi:MAG: PD40 domain-containing protein [Phycisphaerales bacterium]|nr:PD40 domain-containing protein [Phycisphaerales bacterium]